MTTADQLPTGSPGVLADLRAAQRLAHDVFRSMVDAMSHPGLPVTLPDPPASVATVLLPVLAVADLPTSLAIVDECDRLDDLAGLTHRVTGAPVAPVSDADLVVTMHVGSLDGRFVDRLRIGTALAPELGARLIAAVDGISEDEPDEHGSIVATIAGPGSSAGRRVHLTGVDPSALRALDRRNEGYPAGIDTLLVDRAGRMIAIPRSNRIDVLDPKERGGD